MSGIYLSYCNKNQESTFLLGFDFIAFEQTDYLDDNQQD